MRIIAGTAKGRKLISPEGTSARPTSDRAREALFSSLESEFGELHGIRFLDLFAGSGAVTAEAMSRGARSCTVVESDRTALEIARKNVEMVRSTFPESEAVYIEGDVESFVMRPSNPFDVIFLDPPYSFPDSDLTEIVSSLRRSGFIAPSTLVIVERASRSKAFSWPATMRAVKERRYGNAAIYYGEADNG